ncbi:Complement component [Nesidiocoris tenuis]|uniref:Complement component n=1 Tax=Nesidiocoris tenuis TaxID=355587 RepID=A0ABN7AUX6_9HEMI|nr:Complement component [Nesidiocoris tenuis]
MQLLIILFLPVLVKSDISRVSVVCPEVAVPGQSTAVLVSLQQRDEANVTLRLVSVSPINFASRDLLAYNNVKIAGEGTIGVPVPSHAQGELSLETYVNCDFDKATCRPQVTCYLRLVGPVRDVIIRPKSKYYKPGQTVDFWVLAVDHDLKVASDITASVYLIDPSSTKVAIWEQVSLDQDTKQFSVPLSRRTSTGIWRIDVKIEENVFSTTLNVSHLRGCDDPVAPELTIAEEHFVELRFSREMRRRYKPGLPFVGKVEAVSSEKAVRVRVKVLDNTTSIYSQDIEMAGGIGSFMVPAVLSDSELIFLQAELVSVEGKEIDSHYVLAREPIYKWNSSSSCYLLVEEMSETLKPGDMARPTVLSSCPCDSHLHYIVTTEGHLTSWDSGEVPARDIPPGVGIGKPSLCQFNISFKVDAVMAPVSHLLVYYVTGEGEPISDVVSFDVRLLQNQVSVRMQTKNYWNPCDLIDVQIETDRDSYTCLIGGRGREMPIQAMSGGVEMDFTEAGVGLHQWDSNGRENSLEKIEPKFRRSVSSDAELEQIWLWHCFNYSSDIQAQGLQVSAPSEPGKWSLMALSISPSVGLRYSAPVFLQVFRQMDVDFKLPTSLRVGESLEVDIKIGNNLNSCVDVSALLTLSEGAHFQGSSQPFVAEKLRLGPHGATSLVVRMVASTSGNKNMTVEVSAYHSDTCQSVAAGVIANHTLVGTIYRQHSITVNPEGLVKTHIESAYFCANEQMVISTSEEFRYELIPAPRNQEGVVFEVRAGKGVHVALSEEQDLSQKMYQIVIGDQENSVSWLGRGKHGYSVHLTSAATPGILSSDQSKTFWISWDRGAISLGSGSTVHEKRILKWKIDKRMKISFIGFATKWGQPAEFRIWNFNDEAGYSQVIHLDIPRSLLPGSETGTLLVAGGLHLPYLASRMRSSLSEFSSLSTVVSTIASLLSDELLSGFKMTNQSKENQLAEIKMSIQNLMLYRRADGSFSDQSQAKSHWSTVEVLDLLSRAQSVISIDTVVLTSAKKWVQNRQLPDGSFKDSSVDVFPDNLTWIGEPARTVYTTATTLVCLVNLGLENDNDSNVVMKAREFLEKHVDTQLDSITLSALSYSLVKARSDKVTSVLDRLRNASTNDEGEFGWPHQRENSDWLYEEGVEQRKQPVTNHLREFKASLYTLMTYTALKDLKSAEPVARYLFYRSNLLDTHTELINIAIKAFSDFGRLALDENRYLTVSLATSGMELTDTLELKASSEPQLLNLPSLPTKVFIYATGGGCATVQGRISYATYSTSKGNPQLELWAGVIDEVMPKRNSIQELEGKLPLLRLRTCFRWKGSRPPGIIRVEIYLFSGFELVKVSPTTVPIDYGSYSDQIWFAANDVPSDCAVCIDFSMRSEFIINRLRPGLARAYPSGRPDLVSEQFFHARRGSPLLAGTSEDDLITWFGTSVFDEMQELESSFLNACKCGQSCESVKPGTTTGSSKTEEEKQNDEINDFTDIIVFSDLREDLFTTQAEFDRMVSEMDENVTRAESSTPDQPLSQEDQTVSTEAYEEEGELYKNYTADSTLTSIFSSPQPDSPPQHLNKSRADLNDSASHKTDGSPVNSSTANDSTVDHPQQNLPPVLNAFLSSKVNAKSLGKNYVGEKNSKEHFEIRTGEETVNSQLKFAISDGAVSSELPLLQPLKSAELVKAKSSGLLKVSPALVG